MVNLTYESLMALATNKYNTLKQKGQWGVKSPDEQMIVALQAQVDALKGDLKLAGKLTVKRNKEKKDEKKMAKEKKEKKIKNKKSNKDKKEQKQVEAW